MSQEADEKANEASSVLENLVREVEEELVNALSDDVTRRYDRMRGHLLLIVEKMHKIKEGIAELSLTSTRMSKTQDLTFDNDEIGFTLRQEDLKLDVAKQLGQGGFARVFKTDLNGNPVAVKVIKTPFDKEGKRIPLTEGKLLRHLSHDNIVAFRGMGRLEHDVTQHDLMAGAHFIVMEYIPDNLKRYVERQTTHENKGLPSYLVWDFARQIANGLEYLHTMGDPFKPIAHRDLKPDNILLDTSPMSMRVKLADFGLAYQDIFEGRASYFNIRWVAPEVWRHMNAGQYDSDGSDEESSSDESDSDDDSSNSDASQNLEKVSEKKELVDMDSQASKSGYYPSYDADVEFFLQADIYSYGMVLAFCLTSESPWSTVETAILKDEEDWDASVAKVALPEKLSKDDPIRAIIECCYAEDRSVRPRTAKSVIEKYFKDMRNPYKSEPSKAEFFFCGFLKDTFIFVADSLVNEASEGYYQTGEERKGYPKHCLVCEVEVEKKPYHILPKEIEEWEYYELYVERNSYFMEQAEKNVIENNPAIALKSLVTPREGESENQEILLHYAEGTYVHHRAMRDIWRQLSPAEKENVVPSKSHVNKAYSTSFGLHVAVLTADNPPKFFFCRRANRVGMASPREFTCGAVESVSKKDCFEDPVSGKTYVSLLKTAARGLEEELRVELVGDEIDTICLTTVYLKYDTHEWGMCGFVDLSDARIAPERRLTYTQLQSRFTAGPKDKFEHDLVEAVDFTLESMMDFVRQNFMDFASSGKLVVVKVLQSFFGMRTVEHAFQSVDPTLLVD